MPSLTTTSLTAIRLCYNRPTKPRTATLILAERDGQEAVLGVYRKDGNQVKLNSKGMTEPIKVNGATSLGQVV